MRLWLLRQLSCLWSGWTCCWLAAGRLSPCPSSYLAAVLPSPLASGAVTNWLHLGSAWQHWSTRHYKNKKSLSQK